MKTGFGFLLGLVFVCSAASAGVRFDTLTTPRGAKLDVTVHEGPLKSPTLVVAPGQSCNSKGPLFEELGLQGSAANFTVVRFEWAYCRFDPSKPNPSDDLKNEIEDFATVLTLAKSLTSVDAARIFIAGKSLGSVVAHIVFQTTPEARGLILLTPLCSGGEADATYPLLKTEVRPVLMALGEGDSNCPLPMLFDYLKDSRGNIQVLSGGGDHGFRLKKPDGSVDDVRTLKNITTIVGGAMNWTENVLGI